MACSIFLLLFFALQKTSFILRSPPLCATCPPRGTRLKGDDAGDRKYYTISTGGAIAAGA